MQLTWLDINGFVLYWLPPLNMDYPIVNNNIALISRAGVYRQEAPIIHFISWLYGIAQRVCVQTKRSRWSYTLNETYCKTITSAWHMATQIWAAVIGQVDAMPSVWNLWIKRYLCVAMLIGYGFKVSEIHGKTKTNQIKLSVKLN